MYCLDSVNSTIGSSPTIAGKVQKGFDVDLDYYSIDIARPKSRVVSLQNNKLPDTYALLVKCGSYKNALKHSHLARWQVFFDLTPAYDGSALIGDRV